MATNNFINHENGIFVIEQHSIEEVYEDFVEEARDCGEEIEPFDEFYSLYEERLYNRAYFLDEMLIEDYLENLEYHLPYGMRSTIHSNTEAEVFNKQGKLIARLELRAGYYEHMQIIVETDAEVLFGDYYPETQAELFEEYSPHHQRLLNFLSEYTTKIVKIGGFSNGSAVYEIAN